MERARRVHFGLRPDHSWGEEKQPSQSQALQRLNLLPLTLFRSEVGGQPSGIQRHERLGAAARCCRHSHTRGYLLPRSEQWIPSPSYHPLPVSSWPWTSETQVVAS